MKMYVYKNCNYVFQVIRTTYSTRLDERPREDESVDKVALTPFVQDTFLPAAQTEGKFPFFHICTLF